MEILQKLLDIELDYPVNAMTRVCKKLSMPKKAKAAALHLRIRGGAGFGLNAEKESLKKLQEEGHYLAGVPGFFRKKDGDWTFVHEKRGILVPARDRNGAIQGLQVRFDKEKVPDDSTKQADSSNPAKKKKKERKFRWISSVERQDGCPAKCWTHLAGPVRETILLTEGPMKADVIHELSGKTVLAVPGVNSLEQLSLALKSLKAEGLREVKTAFDMDFSTNQHVQNGYHHLLALLGSMGFRYGVYLWDPRYKGLDDYIWDCCLEGRRA